MTGEHHSAGKIEISGLGNKIMLALVLLIPLGFSALGGWFILEGMRFAGSAVKLEATVIDTGRIARDGGDLYRPLFRFETPQGEPREALAHSADSDSGFARGTVVTVLYNSDQPDHVRPQGFWLQYGLWSVFLGLGLFVFAAFAWGIRRAFRREPPLSR